MTADRSHAMDHVVLALFENRSLDNLLGHLYGPEDGKTFEGVVGKDLSNPIPEWAEHGAERKTVPYTVATDMDAPNPDSGEEYFHTNVQLFNTSTSTTGSRSARRSARPGTRPSPARCRPWTASSLTTSARSPRRSGRQPTYEEYAQIMTGYTPEQVPVLNGIARGFGVFDHGSARCPRRRS